MASLWDLKPVNDYTAVNRIMKEIDDVEIIYDCCCGIDVHKDKLAVCILRRNRKRIMFQCGTKTNDLEELVQV